MEMEEETVEIGTIGVDLLTSSGEETTEPLIPTDPITPVIASRLRECLKGCPHPMVEIFKDGFEFGFYINFHGDERTYIAKNSAMALTHVDAVNAKINKELLAGHFLGPFDVSPFPVYRCSPLSIRPKKVPNKYKLIHDLSYPYDESSMNAGIPDKFATVQYISVVDAIKEIVQIKSNSPSCFLAKLDSEAA